MLVSSTPTVKKRKKTSAPSSSKAVKKKKRKCTELEESCIPELILCADQLKKDPVKVEENDKPTYEPILEPKIELIEAEEVDSKSDNIIKVKKKKKKKKVEIAVEKKLKEENPSLTPEDLSKLETVDSDVLLIKSEPTTPEKPSVKIEPTEFTSLFNSNIKQELEEIDDAVDEHVCKKLSFKLSDSCIERYCTTLHCAIPPSFIHSIKNGIKSQLKTLHLKYLEPEQGVLLRYTNIKFKERAARIVSISPELHFDISCLVTVFKPKLGAVLEGTVIKIGPGYVNCLVFGYFTAVVYDRFSNPVEIGSLIRFKLKFFQVTVHNDFILKGSPVPVE